MEEGSSRLQVLYRICTGIKTGRCWMGCKLRIIVSNQQKGFELKQTGNLRGGFAMNYKGWTLCAVNTVAFIIIDWSCSLETFVCLLSFHTCISPLSQENQIKRAVLPWTQKSWQHLLMQCCWKNSWLTDRLAMNKEKKKHWLYDDICHSSQRLLKAFCQTLSKRECFPL